VRRENSTHYGEFIIILFHNNENHFATENKAEGFMDGNPGNYRVAFGDFSG